MVFKFCQKNLMINSIKCFLKIYKNSTLVLSIVHIRMYGVHKIENRVLGIYCESPIVNHKEYHSCLQTLSVYDIKVSEINDYKLITKKLAHSFQVTSRLLPYTMELLLHIYVLQGKPLLVQTG